MKAEVDYLVIGGGFYGIALALFLRSVSKNIVVVEAGDDVLSRASRVNQARVHTGFHYPRSILTAVKSMTLHRRFARDFPDAVVGNFQMLYAIARYRSKVSAKRFHRMFRDIGAPIMPAGPSQAALFNSQVVDAVFACAEFAFDHAALRRHLLRRLDDVGLRVELNTSVEALEEREDAVVATLANGREVTARFAFNVTYAHLNEMLRRAGLATAALKYEITEIALCTPPEELRGFGVTVMDGPFFSTMPYPAEALHSLTHVRYTPHRSWTDVSDQRPPYAILTEYEKRSRVQHMIADGKRYLPCLSGAEWRRSLFDVKTVLLKNEIDDGRPILFHRHPRTSRVISILGGKIDNIYDLFELLSSTKPEWAAADMRYIRPAAE